MTRYLWFALGWICVGLGAIGLVLPLMPTVVFLIVAAYAFSKSSDRFHRWLMDHKHFGPPLVAWQTHGAISRPNKIAATIAISASVVITWFVGIPVWALTCQILVLACVLIFLLTRPAG